MIKRFIKPPLKNNNYLVADEKTGEAILVDCSHPDDEIVTWAKNNGFNLKYILLTHGHFDHISGVQYYTDHYGLSAYLYQEDSSLLSRFNEYRTMLGLDENQPPKVHFFSPDTVFKLGSYSIQVLPTSGHTQGGVCYLVDGNLFSGDTLFYETYGRTDLPESDTEQMKQSLEMLFKTLPDSTRVYPGHGVPTTIEHERQHFFNYGL